jgi:hypothetical protein
MRRHIPGFHFKQQDPGSNLDRLFVVRIDKAVYRWLREKPSQLQLRQVGWTKAVELVKPSAEGRSGD